MEIFSIVYRQYMEFIPLIHNVILMEGCLTMTCAVQTNDVHF